MFDIRMQTNNKGVISAAGLTRTEAIAYIDKHITELSERMVRSLVATALRDGIVNVTTEDGNDIGIESYSAATVKRHYIGTMFAQNTRCGRPSRSVETTTHFSSVTCAICSGRTSH